jgi:protein-tyrosine phosphatase
MSERSLKPNFGSRSQASLVSNSSTTSSRRVPDAKLQPANPFFDNIRQNLELSHGGITERISLGVPEEAKRRAHELPAFLAELVEMPEDDSADKGAKK